ncbi:uncharacterized protein KGF55_000389 [Candida pseudojiufengensis]|uniref:uncharacterized protein n=1 Tax=Candida pseudojiufengensis TaxID=497109 RepID=UPI002223F884|nr:uncharacterized protein KGF55_000389 [Candida pseudojiufengensis]KAI5966980.1 hypothetical protein KGF55_000389 [Candida pseudojiufengensis]
MTDEIPFSNDPTIEELQTLGCIYDDLLIDFNLLCGSINIPIKIDQGIVINLTQRNTILSTQNINHLPPITFNFSISDGYPFHSPPSFDIKSKSLSDGKINKLKNQLFQIWDENKDRVLYESIMYIQEQVQDSLNEILPQEFNFEDFEKFNEFLVFDKKEKQKEFEARTFTCEICQIENKGLTCTIFEECKHVFCNECLTGFFTSIINEGDINNIHCPEYNCMKNYKSKRDEMIKIESWTLADKNIKEVVDSLFTPNVPLYKLKSLLPPPLVEKYLLLFKKSQFELIKKLLPKRVVECPRFGCEELIFREDLNDKLVVCKKCKYAFCIDCRNSYHARFKKCVKIHEKYEGIPVEDLMNYQYMPQGSHEKKILHAKYGRSKVLKAIDEYQMDKLFEEMIKQGTELKECPGCGAIIEKSDGCNRMKCCECRTCFCFNCGVQMDNTYDHFSDPTSPCYKLLFFGMVGAEDENQT